MASGSEHDLLQRGAASFDTRDSLLAGLDRLDQRLPTRNQGRTKDHRERYVIARYLQLLARNGLLEVPVTVERGGDPPDCRAAVPRSLPDRPSDHL